MDAKTCIALALTVLFGALALGNPFLRPCPFLRPTAYAAAPFANVHLISLRAGVSLQEGVVQAAERTLPPCPDPALQAQVTEVRFDAAGEPNWILRDGRVLRRDTVTQETVTQETVTQETVTATGARH